MSSALSRTPPAGLFLAILFVTPLFICIADACRSSSKACPNIISRQQWGAEEAKGKVKVNSPVPMLIIHHTYTKPCSTESECAVEMRYIQNFHMVTRGWDDIGYNFLIGGDGNVYEGRGWGLMGAHAKGYNHLSIGVSFIGDFIEKTPEPAALEAAQQLISCAVDKGFLSANYQLKGHRDVGSTECPGEALYQIIQKWPHFG